ncbi:beta strand repeat-containing protein [Geminisphaera colitermitum]|uniref:beta strand repeat-containing protein n=1 Tax=Geminisphaera colitermitum TaxID=1148786 RepID=UPI000158C51A|nr:hypothetical protein [Geminisphaera colitermitum]
MKPLPALLLRLCAGLSFILTSNLLLHAETYTWTGASTTNTSWNTVENWDANGVAQSGTDTEIILAKSGNYTVTQNTGAGMSFNKLVFSAASGNVSIGGTNSFAITSGTPGTPGEIQMNSNGSSSMSNQLTLNRTFTYTGSGTGQLLLSGIVQGTGGIVVDAAGILALTTAKSFAGGLTLKNGTVTLTTTGAAGTGAITLEGGTIRNSTSTGYVTTTFTNALNLSGDTRFGSNGQRALEFTGNTTIAGDATTRELTLHADAATTTNLVLSGAITDNGKSNGLTFKGRGTVRIGGSSTNTYTGATTVDSTNVILLLDKTNGADATAGALVVKDGKALIETGIQKVGALSLLGGTAKISSGATLATAGIAEIHAGTLDGTGTLQILDGGALSLGGTGHAETVTFTGGLNLAGGSSLFFDLGTSSDKLTLDGPLTVSGDGSITLHISNAGGLVAGTPYTLFSVAGGFTGVDNATANDRFTILGTDITGTFSINGTDLILTVTSAIPEPSTWVWITGTLSLLIAARVRKHLRTCRID